MTPTQVELLELLRTHFRQHEHGPSYEELRVALGLAAKSGVARMIDALERDGMVERDRNRTRSLRLTAKGWGRAPGYLAAFSTHELRAELARRETADAV